MRHACVRYESNDTMCISVSAHLRCQTSLPYVCLGQQVPAFAPKVVHLIANENITGAEGQAKQQNIEVIMLVLTALLMPASSCGASINSLPKSELMEIFGYEAQANLSDLLQPCHPWRRGQCWRVRVLEAALMGCWLDDSMSN